MKIRIERDLLAESAAWVARSLPSRPPVPVLGGVLIEAKGDSLSLAGFDYDTSTRVDVDATVHDPGKVLVSARLLADITKALPRKPVDVVVDGPRMAIACGSAKFSLLAMPIEDYPTLPKVADRTGTVDADLFASAVAQVAPAAGRDDALPMLTGVRLEVDGPQLTLAATDRFRLAVRDLEWQPDQTDLKTGALIPAETLASIAKSLTGGPVEIGLGDGMLAVTTPTRRATTRLLDAEFPRFRQLIPTEYGTSAEVEVAALVEAIKRVALVADRVAQIRLEFGEDGLRLAAGGEEVGSAEEELPALLVGSPLTIAFNPQYLLDALAALHTPRAQLTFTTPARPGLVRGVWPDGEPGQSYLHLLMPVRIPGQG